MRWACLAILAFMVLSPSAWPEERPPASPEARRIETLVKKAAALVDEKGKTALNEFRQPNSEWWSGNLYVFAYAADGTVLLNPATPSREGKAFHGELDKNGKAFHDAILETAKSKGEGWVDYWLPKPGQTEPSHKWSYVKAVKAEGVAVVGAGFYPE
jgi:cytochrome c